MFYVSNLLFFSAAVVTTEVAGGDLEPHLEGKAREQKAGIQALGALPWSEKHEIRVTWTTLAAASLPGLEAGMEMCN